MDYITKKNLHMLHLATVESFDDFNENLATKYESCSDRPVMTVTLFFSIVIEMLCRCKLF